MFSLDPNCKYFLDTLEFILKIVAGIGGFYLFIVGLRRYKKDQIWKRNEFVAKEIKEFTADKMVRDAMFMLDWGSRYIELFPNKAKEEERFAKVDRRTLKASLIFHELRVKEPDKDRFTSTEVAIRDTFDHFLFYLERFDHFIEAGLISPAELKPYLKYWIDTIANRMEPEVRNVLYHYINVYGYTGVQDLFLHFGKNIKPTRDINTTKFN